MEYLRPQALSFTLGNGMAIYKGADWKVYFTLTSGDDPIDITGATGTCTIKTKTGASTITASPVVTIEDPTAGVVSLSLSNSVTSAIPAIGDAYYDTTDYQYDVYLTLNDKTFRVLNGFVEVSPNIGA